MPLTWERLISFRPPEDFYQTKEERIDIGSVRLNLVVLQNLDQTIDKLFDWLRSSGRESLLEELCPYFGTLWPSAFALTQQLVELITREMPKLSVRKPLQILELGCGLALPSLALARFGFPVVATDFHPEVPRFLERNCERNEIKNLEYIEFAWKDAPPENLAHRHFDWIIASDVLYESHHADALAMTLGRLATTSTEIFIADPARPYLQRFMDQMQIELPTHTATTEVRETSGKEIYLLRFTP